MNRSSPWLVVLFLVMVTGAAACGGEGGQNCTTLAAASLGVTVVDATTSQRICDATVIATVDGESIPLDAMGPGGECLYVGPYERAGSFTIEVSKSGYVSQTVTAVVTEDACHVRQENVTVTLQPS